MTENYCAVASKFDLKTWILYHAGRLATAEYLIKKEDLHDRIILSYSRRGTAKLVVPELALDDWVVDVYRLDIE